MLLTRGAYWVVAAVLALPAAASAGEPAPHQLADRALALLRRHCLGCHGASAALRGGVNVLDHVRLVAPERGLIVPGDPEASTLLTRVRTGSMPPGRHTKLSAE